MDEISDYFTCTIINQVAVKPIRGETKRVQGYVQESAAAVPCEICGGNNGNLGVTVLGEDYVSATTEEFVEHKNLDPSPIVPENTTQRQTIAAK